MKFILEFIVGFIAVFLGAVTLIATLALIDGGWKKLSVDQQLFFYTFICSLVLLALLSPLILSLGDHILTFVSGAR
jgi:hypothetical protein